MHFSVIEHLILSFTLYKNLHKYIPQVILYNSMLFSYLMFKYKYK